MSAGEVTRLLLEWRRGDRGALERMLPFVYDLLRQRAAAQLAREHPGHTLQPTALVHEIYARLADQHGHEWRDRAHFLGVAAHLMRLVLIDHARAAAAAKRGGGAVRVTLTDVVDAGDHHELDLETLDQALQRLEAVDPRAARIVEMRFFAGLSIEEVAEVLGLSPATVKREWRMARAWLRTALEGAR